MTLRRVGWLAVSAGGIILIALTLRPYFWPARPPVVVPPAIETRRTEVSQEQAELTRQEARLKSAIEETRRMAETFKATLRGMDANLAHLQAERRRVIESGTPDEILALGRKLGYHPALIPGCPSQ